VVWRLEIVPHWHTQAFGDDAQSQPVTQALRARIVETGASPRATLVVTGCILMPRRTEHMAGFAVSESPVQPTAVVRGTALMSELPSFFGTAFSAVAAVLNARGTPPTHEPFAYLPDEAGLDY
jgi:hypothetical protein